MPTPNNLASIFSQLPNQQLLTVAKDIQLRLLTDKKDYDVTPADYALQRIILDYFAQSDLADNLIYSWNLVSTGEALEIQGWKIYRRIQNRQVIGLAVARTETNLIRLICML